MLEDLNRYLVEFESVMPERKNLPDFNIKDPEAFAAVLKEVYEQAPVRFECSELRFFLHQFQLGRGYDALFFCARKGMIVSDYLKSVVNRVPKDKWEMFNFKSDSEVVKMLKEGLIMVIDDHEPDRPEQT